MSSSNWHDNLIGVHCSLLSVQRALAVEIIRMQGTAAAAMHIETLRCIHKALLAENQTLLEIIKGNGSLGP